MQKHNFTLGLMFGALGLATVASGQEARLRPEKGAHEVSVAGNLTFTTGSSSGTIEVQNGYYLSKAFLWTLGDSLTLSSTTNGGSTDTSTTSILNLGLRYYLDVNSKTAPYLFINTLYLSDSSGTTASGAAIGAGVDFFQNRNSSFFAELSEQSFSEDGGGSSSQVQVLFGLRFISK
jgi:hypothetical protein